MRAPLITFELPSVEETPEIRAWLDKLAALVEADLERQFIELGCYGSTPAPAKPPVNPWRVGIVDRCT